MPVADKKGGQNLTQGEKAPGIVLLKKIQDKELDPKTLTPTLRRLCVRILRYEKGSTVGEIASFLGCSEKTIDRDYRKIEQENFDLHTGMEIRRELSEILHYAETYARLEAKKGTYKEAWKIRREKIELLQSLGFLPKNLGTMGIEDGRGPKKETEVIDFDNLTEEQQALVDVHWNEILKIVSDKGKAEEGSKALNP